MTILTALKCTYNPGQRFACFAISLVAYILGPVMQCQDYLSYLAVFGLYVGTMFVISINSMVWDYLDLVSRHMTIKEKVSRLKAIKELGLVKKDDFKL